MMVRVKELSKSYSGQKVLSIPQLEIAQGARFGLVGNNGAGKTTFFSLLLDLIKADSGTVFLNGDGSASAGDWKKFTGSYLDESFLIDYLTPREYFRFLGGLHGFSGEELRNRLEPFAEFLTEEVTDTRKYIRELSSGNRKKVGLAAALFFGPKLIILDEPFPYLDPTSVIRLKRILTHLAEERTVTMLISSHDLNHVTDICKRIALLEKGEIKRDIETTPETLNELETYFASQI